MWKYTDGAPMNNTIFTEDHSPLLHSKRVPLYTGGVAAILASICCIGSFLFIAIGLSSSKSLYLITLAEWIRVPLLVVSLVALVFAYLRIWHPVSTYKHGEACANPQVTMTNKVFFLVIAALVIGMFMLPYIVQSID